MAIEYVGGQVAGRANPSSALSVNFALTGGLASVPAAGDLVIVTCVTGSAGGNPAMAVATPSDYTPLGQLNQSATTNDTSMNVSYKVMADPPDTAVTIPGTTNNAWAEAYAIQVFRGVDLTTPMDVAAVSGGGTGTGRPNPGSINPVTAGVAVVICGGGAAGTGAIYTAPANYTTDFVTASGADTTDAMVGCGYRLDPADPEDPAAYTGGTTNAADSWCSYTLALRPAADAVSVGITGEAGTSGVGSFAAAVVIALSGVVGTADAGTLTPATSGVSIEISGEAATGAVGSFALQVSAVLSGNAGMGSPGTITVGVSRSITGNAATGARGSLAPTVSTALSGQAGTGAVGTLTATAGFNVAISGESATGAAGSVGAGVSRALTGETATGAVGTLAPTSGVNVALTGNPSTGAAGNLGAGVSTVLAGQVGTSAVGTVIPSSGFIAAISGNGATGGMGSLAASVAVALDGNGAAGAVGTMALPGAELHDAAAGDYCVKVPAEQRRLAVITEGRRPEVPSENRKRSA
jgi:hypothetical protein